MEALPEDMLTQLTALHDTNLLLDEKEAAHAEAVDMALCPVNVLLERPKPRRTSVLGIEQSGDCRTISS